jgi:hypothetical protein
VDEFDGATAIVSTERPARGIPLSLGFQLSPPSVLLKSTTGDALTSKNAPGPPAKSVVGVCGASASARMSKLVMPLFLPTQLVPPFVVLNTPGW